MYPNQRQIYKQMDKLGLWKSYSNVQHKQKHLQKLLYFPLKLNSAYVYKRSKCQSSKEKWNMHIFMYEHVIFSQSAQFSSKLLKMEACINDDKARPRHRELRSLLLARSVWVRKIPC